ncbi:MAG: hypothetical protein VB036_07720 [Propionicimonas sp.]|nr:hypothetical protein [Propionicimonas sp.]
MTSDGAAGAEVVDEAQKGVLKLIGRPFERDLLLDDRVELVEGPPDCVGRNLLWEGLTELDPSPAT